MRCSLSRLPLTLGLFAFPSLALAGPGTWSAPPDDPAIWSGEEVEVCGWPTTVHVSNGGSWCTGTLIHPRVVAYAAHCGASNTRIRFGQNYNSARVVVPTKCEVNPGYTNPSNDWAYCLLPDEIDLPITPAVMGCESQYVQNGGSVAIVGFGNNSGDTGSGTKRWGMTTLSQLNWNGNTVNVGGGGAPTVCSGDSGGPIFVQYPDNSWHALGIASVKYSSTCDSAQGQHSLMSGAIPWIEQQAGIDVTPCHDASGNWAPGPLCTNVLTSGSNGYGDWGNWCEGTPATSWLSTCGPGFGDEMETNPPSVTITSPADGQAFADAPTTIPIDIDATDDSGYVEFVQIEIDGTLLPDQDLVAPWRFSTVTFPQGSYTIRAYAEDFWGNSAYSAPVTVHVGDVDPGDTSGDATTGAETTGEESTTGDSSTDGSSDTGLDDSSTGGGTDDGVALGDDGGSDSGCGCDAGSGRSGGLLALFGLVALGRTRRRRV